MPNNNNVILDPITKKFIQVEPKIENPLPFVELIKLEDHTIYCGDNKDILSKFPEKSVDLIYADPPFFSNKNYEIIWGNGAEMKVFEDRMKGGIMVYSNWMEERLWQCYRVLKDTGSMYLHCDWHANYRLRGIMERIFGPKNFLNEIIWHYKGAGASRKRFGRKHDNILFYTKSGRYVFNMDDILEPVTKAQKNRYTQKDEGGFYGIHHGRKYYLPQGRIPDDVFNIPLIVPTSTERTGYPTQKPEALLTRIIKASSNPGDIILDPFCGCGTTLVVAQQLDRRWIGIDVSPKACTLMKDRLNKIGVSGVRIFGFPETIEDLKKIPEFQFQNLIIDRMKGTPSKKKVGDMGIDGYTFMTRDPVQIKQSEGVGRNVIDNFETAIRREHKTIGCIIAFSFTKGAYEETARAKSEEGLDIKLVRVIEMDKYFK